MGKFCHLWPNFLQLWLNFHQLWLNFLYRSETPSTVVKFGQPWPDFVNCGSVLSSMTEFSSTVVEFHLQKWNPIKLWLNSVNRGQILSTVGKFCHLRPNFLQLWLNFFYRSETLSIVVPFWPQRPNFHRLWPNFFNHDQNFNELWPNFANCGSVWSVVVKFG